MSNDIYFLFEGKSLNNKANKQAIYTHRFISDDLEFGCNFEENNSLNFDWASYFGLSELRIDDLI